MKTQAARRSAVCASERDARSKIARVCAQEPKPGAAGTAPGWPRTFLRGLPRTMPADADIPPPVGRGRSTSSLSSPIRKSSRQARALSEEWFWRRVRAPSSAMMRAAPARPSVSLPVESAPVADRPEYAWRLQVRTSARSGLGLAAGVTPTSPSLDGWTYWPFRVNVQIVALMPMRSATI